MGMHSVHTFTALGCQGLIRVGKTPSDVRHAHASLVNREATQSVGIYVTVSDDTQTSSLDALSVILATFRFIEDELGAPEEIEARMTQAGILPRQPADANW